MPTPTPPLPGNTARATDPRAPAPFRLSNLYARGPRTLRGRLTLTLIGLVIGVLALLGLYLGIAGRQLYVDRLSNQLAAQASMASAAIGPLLATDGDIAAVDPVIKRLGAGLDARITIIAADGAVLGDSLADPRSMDNHGHRPEVLAAHAAGQGKAERHSLTLDEDFLYVAVMIPDSDGAVARVALPLDEVNAAVARIRRDIATAMVVAGLLAAAVGAFIADRITGPLQQLRYQARAVAAGRLDATVQPAVEEELGDLGRAFNTMTANLRALVSAQEQTRTRLEATLANLNDGVVLTDTADNVVSMNVAASRMLEVPSERAVGQPFLVACRDHDLAALLRQALESGGAVAAAVDYSRGERTLEAFARPFSSGGEQLGLLVLRDVTDLRRLERVRREFVANVSHELRTPLASIRAVVETLEAGAIDDPEVATGFLGRIIGEVDHLAGLVNELLDLARLESGRAPLKLDRHDPAEMLRATVERLRPQADRAGLSLRIDTPTNLSPAVVDRGRIEQVLINLIHNAIKFTPEGGEIVVGASEADGMLRVTVRDTGIGIAAEELPRVFERFYKTDPARRSPGTGLGLAIAKHIIQAHRGAIWAESIPGQGTTITFAVPVSRSQ